MKKSQIRKLIREILEEQVPIKKQPRPHKKGPSIKDTIKLSSKFKIPFIISPFLNSSPAILPQTWSFGFIFLSKL